jgi:hypothetical protein
VMTSSKSLQKCSTQSFIYSYEQWVSAILKDMFLPTQHSWCILHIHAIFKILSLGTMLTAVRDYRTAPYEDLPLKHGPFLQPNMHNPGIFSFQWICVWGHKEV